MSGERVTMTNLGSGGNAQLTLANRQRFDWAGWAIGCFVILLGLRLKAWPARIRFLLITAFLALLIPVVIGFSNELEPAQQRVQLALALLVVCFLIRDCWRWVFQWAAHHPAAQRTAAMALVSVLGISGGRMIAQDDPFGTPNAAQHDQQIQHPEEWQRELSGRRVTELGELRDLLRDSLSAQPIVNPKDAIVVPYDPSDNSSPVQNQRILVPYDTYQDLLKKIADRQSPNRVSPARDYALGGIAYSAKLVSGESLRMTGQLTIDQFVEGDILVPLQLGNCVLESATLDGQAARLHVLASSPPVDNQPSPAQQSANQADMNEQPGAPLVMLTTGGSRS